MSDRAATFSRASRWTVGLLLVALALALGWAWQRNGSPRDQQADSAAPAKEAASRLPRETSQLGREDETARPFWESAVVPEPVHPRLPTAAIPPVSPDLPPVDYGELVSRLEKESDNAKALNDAFLLWFAQDYRAATEWANATARFDELVPGITAIALELSSRRDLDFARSWVESLPFEQAHTDALIRIYGLAYRQRAISIEDLQATGLSPESISLITSGHLDD